MADEPVLIALSIDGVLALYRQRALVREAHAAIAQEIDANLSDLEGALPALDAHDRHLEQALRFADDLLRTGKTDVHELRFALNFASLNRASWQTAESECHRVRRRGRRSLPFEAPRPRSLSFAGARCRWRRGGASGARASAR